MTQYDVVVLGAGPGGYVSAIRAAQLGAKTAIIERSQVGGTCLNAGCIPTKALMKNVEILRSIEEGNKRGIKFEGKLLLDYAKAVKAKNKAVKQLVSGVKALLDSNDVHVYQGSGCIGENKTIMITGSQDETEIIRYEKLIIATGSSPKKTPIPGVDAEGVLTSEDLLQIETVPKHLIIIGGGIIGCEFSAIFHTYGSKITIVEMLPNLVDMLDQDVCAYMGEMLSGQGMELKLGKQVKEIGKKTDGALEVTIGNQEEEEVLCGDMVLISIGRAPNLEGLEALGLEMEKGHVSVNEKLETSAKDIYAIGDVTGKKQLAHVASEMGIIAAENAMGANQNMQWDIVPSCIYTIPEVGSVGLSEAEARAKGYEVIAGKFPLAACGKAVATGDTEGLFKIVADKKSRKVLGAHLIGKSATEIIAELAAYIKMNACIDDITHTIHAHPTISESVAEAARDVDGCAVHMPKKK